MPSNDLAPFLIYTHKKPSFNDKVWTIDFLSLVFSDLSTATSPNDTTFLWVSTKCALKILLLLCLLWLVLLFRVSLGWFVAYRTLRHQDISAPGQFGTSTEWCRSVLRQFGTRFLLVPNCPDTSAPVPKYLETLRHHPSKIHMGYCFVRIGPLLVLYAEICQSYNYSPAVSNRQCINLMRAKTCIKLLLWRRNDNGLILKLSANLQLRFLSLPIVGPTKSRSVNVI